MAKSENQKLKIIYLRELLLETDEDHPITMDQILMRLRERGVDAERKSIYSDLEALRVYGMDIGLKKLGRTAAYYLGMRDFEVAELKLLVDSIQAAKFLSEKKSLQLIKKLAALSSRHERELLNRQLMFGQRLCTWHNIAFLLNLMEDIRDAIANDAQIRFRYWQYNVEKEQELRHNGKTYQVSPFALIWDDENYYLLAYDPETGICKHFRVDKMTHIAVRDEPRDGKEVFGLLNMSAYTKRNFSMFAGKEQLVTLRCDNSMIGVIIDRFGRSVSVTKQDDAHFSVSVKIAVSPQFFGWLSSFEGKVVPIAPQDVREQYRAHLFNVLESL